MVYISVKQLCVLLVLWCQVDDSQPLWGRRAGLERRSRIPCPEVKKLSQASKLGCVSKYVCDQECETKKKCKTRYKYKCTDYRRRECKNVWQNQCNGKRGKREARENEEDDIEQVVVNGVVGPPRTLRRQKRLIETEVVYDQSYPVPESDVPLAEPAGGQIFQFASPPKSKSCWKRVRECEWVKYTSKCRNQPVKECDDTPSQVCKRKCKRIYHCYKCPDGDDSDSGSSGGGGRPSVTTPRPTRPPRPRPPAPPPSGTFVVRPPAPPGNQDTIIITRRRP